MDNLSKLSIAKGSIVPKIVSKYGCYDNNRAVFVRVTAQKKP